MMKTTRTNIILLTLILFVLLPSSLFAYRTNMGTINIEVGQEVQVYAEKYLTATGNWSKTSNCFGFAAKSQKSCTIRGTQPGNAELSWVGVIEATDYDMYWTVNVTDPNSEGGTGGESGDSGGNSGGENSENTFSDKWTTNGNYDISWYDKTKKEFSLSTAKELAGFAYIVNNGYDNFKNKIICLTSNIDLSGKLWQAVGTEQFSFEGTFDGQNYIISGLNIEKHITNQIYYGFWGYVHGGTIKDIEIRGTMSIINSDTNSNTGKMNYVGSLVGFASECNIENCKSSVTVNYTRNIQNSGEISEIYIGGLIGYYLSDKALLSKCCYYGTINCRQIPSSAGYYLAGNPSVGGLVGYAGLSYGTWMEHCESEVNINAEHPYTSRMNSVPTVAGLVAEGYGEIRFCRTICNIEINHHGFPHYQGSINYLRVGGITFNGGKITNCFAVVQQVKASCPRTDWTLKYHGIGGTEGYESNNKACYSNSDVSFNSSLSVSKDLMGTTYTTDMMKSIDFLSELNTYSKLELGKEVWMLKDNPSNIREQYPCLLALDNIATIPVTSISLNKTSASLYTIAPGNTVQLTATVYPSDATNKTVTWSSSNNNVATVSNSGLVTAKAGGTTTITCKANDGSGVTATCNITVENEQVYPTSISGVKNTLSMKIDDVYTLYWYYSYPSGTDSNKEVKPNATWSSDNVNVAKVSSTGDVTAVSTGSATITVKSENGLSASCAVTVIEEAKPLNRNIKMMATGFSHSLLLTDDGTLWACGWNNHGQLGDGTTEDQTTPVRVMNDVASMTAGSYHSLILKTDGTLWATGSNSNGQLGDGTTTGRTTPVQVMSGVASMAAGRNHSLILKTDGTLWATGSNSHGQLGDGTTTTQITPVQVMSGVASVSAGGYHSLILKTDGTLWACGYNRCGQLGDGTTTPRPTTPVQVMSDVASVAAGDRHSLILKTDGTLWACGDNSQGQLGDGTTEDQTTPVRVMNDVASMTAGRNHSLILKTDGTLWATGSNSNGQLGDGTTTGRTTPMQVTSEVTSIATCWSHSLILKSDGTLWACGDNDSGQLGDGTNIDRHTPVKIAENTSSSIMGTGTEADPFNSAAAYELASSLGANTPTEQVYYVKGKVVSVKEQFGTQYGNATFYISDDGTTANQFYIYKAKYLGNKKYAGEDLKLNVGDEVVVCGKLVNYIGTLPGTVQDEAYVVSINGTKGSTHERGDVNGDGVVNIADLMMLVNILTGK